MKSPAVRRVARCWPARLQPRRHRRGYTDRCPQFRRRLLSFAKYSDVGCRFRRSGFMPDGPGKPVGDKPRPTGGTRHPISRSSVRCRRGRSACSCPAKALATADARAPRAPAPRQARSPTIEPTTRRCAPDVPIAELLSGFDAGKGQIDRVPENPVCPP
jgi:hypothetical protein